MGKFNKGGLVGGFDQLKAPDAPTIGAALTGNTQVSVAFTAASDAGAGTASSFVVTGIVGGVTTGATGTSSPIAVTGLTNGTEVTFSVIAISEFGSSPSSGTVAETPSNPGKAFFMGGFAEGRKNTISFVSIITGQNAADFGDLTVARTKLGGASSATKAVMFGGNTENGNNGPKNTIDMFTMASTGNATDFGDISSSTKHKLGAFSNATRAIESCGQTGDSGRLSTQGFITIANTGNTSDFGGASNTKLEIGVASSKTLGMVAGGQIGSGNITGIDKNTIATTGSVATFGNLTAARKSLCNASVSSNTIALFAGGTSSNVIDQIVMASDGNATDFGDLTVVTSNFAGTSNRILGVFAGGDLGGGSGTTNVIQKVTIASAGNATDFGDLISYVNGGSGVSGPAAASDSHGGL